MKIWKSCLTAALVLAAASAFSAEPLLLQWGTIDTSGTEAQAESATLKAKVSKKAALLRARKSADEERASYVVQFPAPITEEWRTWLESSTQVRGYLPEFAYLVWATAAEMETIADNENVFWIGEWKKEYKTVRAGSASSSSSAKSAAPARWMHIGSFLTGDDGAAGFRARLEALPAEVLEAFPRLDGSSAVALLTDAQIDEVAFWPDVEWIEPKLEPRPFNDQAALTNMMNVTPAWKAISAGGLGLTGTNQIVAVADTGCDKGSLTDTHADFADRILAGYGWKGGSYGSSYSWADYDAHGTHVCGSIFGSGAASTNQFRGMAYEAQLVVQGCQTNLDGLPVDTHSLLSQAYDAGARIHSDSWGYTNADYHGDYLYAAVYSDGYMWTNQNFLMVIAAGNDGIDADKDGVIDPTSVTPPGTAKNCLCVGAAENYRSGGGYAASMYGGKWPSDFPADPVKSDKISSTNVPQGIAAFSGRGPTADGRFKPDIVAPGTDVISVRSRAASGTGWGVAANTNYLYMGGTSMATPLTSGALALVRQWLVERKGIAEPPAALMKALLINGARDMAPGQYGTGATREITARPDRSQGFGHVNLCNALLPGSGNFLVFATNRLTTANTFTTNIAVGRANAGTYVITLAWQDYPAEVGAAKTLVNDLDLTVTSPSGIIYYPNNLSGPDHTNNVEFIEFTAPETGTYRVCVAGYNVAAYYPNGGQPFALVMRGPSTSSTPAAPAFSSTAASATGVTGETFTYDFASLLTAGYPAPTYHMHTSVSSYSFDTSTGVLTFTPSAAGNYTFTCIANNPHGSATCALTVTITPPPPGVPEGLALSNVGPISFTASWSAAANAESYFLDVAAVSGPTPSYVSLAGYPKSVTSTSVSVTGLSRATDYAVRVRSVNSAASSDWTEWVATTTAEDDFAPVWFPFPDQNVYIGDTLAFTPAAYLAGSPTPTVTLDSTTASYGYAFETGTLSYTPSTAGTATFTFLASNSLGTASATLAVTATEFVETKYALCVGINTYSSGNSTLAGCVNDAAYFYTNLVERGGWTTDHMTKLTDTGATKAAIRKAITNCAAQAVSGDTFVYQHSSHGGRNSGQSVYLCTHEGYYEDYELAADLAKFASGVKVVIVVDACHSGGLFKGNTTAKAAKTTFNLAERVTALMEENRARRLARGERGVEKSIAASEIGWVTAADYPEYSLDGGYYDTSDWMTSTNKGRIMGGVFLGSFTWGWWDGSCDTKPGSGDNDGQADAYECWSIAYECCTNTSLWGSDAFTPQCTNTAVLRSVELGWIGSSAPTNPPASAPVWAAIPHRTVDVCTDCWIDLAEYASGAPAPTITLVSATADSGDYEFEDGCLLFIPPAAGDYTFTFSAANSEGSATAILTITVTNPDYEQWLAENGYPQTPSTNIASNGRTYWENYIADIDPTSTNELAIVPDLSTGSTFTVPSASSNRYYQLIYSTNLALGLLTNNLGWGATGASGITFPSDWYGSIRVLLDAPAEP